jgi:Flp pilus assembly CpaF family ATPase
VRILDVVAEAVSPEDAATQAGLKKVELGENSTLDALYRLEDLIGEASSRIPHRAIASGIDLIVFISRTRNGRQIDSIDRVRGWTEAGHHLERLI